MALLVASSPPRCTPFEPPPASINIVRVVPSGANELLIEFDADYTLVPYVGNQFCRCGGIGLNADGSNAVNRDPRWAWIQQNGNDFQAGDCWTLLAPGFPDVVNPVSGTVGQYLVLEVRQLGPALIEVTFDAPVVSHFNDQFRDTTDGTTTLAFFSQPSPYKMRFNVGVGKFLSGDGWEYFNAPSGADGAQTGTIV